MPVRFRCVYCNQLLGISRRKAGMVVRCTNCSGQIIVPEPEPMPEAVGAVSGTSGTRTENAPVKESLFEHADIDELLKPLTAVGKPIQTSDATAQTASSPKRDQPNDEKPVAVVISRPVPTERLWLMVLMVLIIAVASFFTGYFVGKG